MVGTDSIQILACLSSHSDNAKSTIAVRGARSGIPGPVVSLNRLDSSKPLQMAGFRDIAHAKVLALLDGRGAGAMDAHISYDRNNLICNALVNIIMCANILQWQIASGERECIKAKQRVEFE